MMSSKTTSQRPATPSSAASGNRGDLGAYAAELLDQVRAQRPLVHQITNHVVMNDSANLTLHLGALPVMAHAADEVAEMAAHAGALVLNIGTLSPPWIEGMLIAGRSAGDHGVPVILDPVGAGATTYRTETARRILDSVAVRLVRGNAGEIAALIGQSGQVRGVESVGEVGDPATLARLAATQLGTVVAMTGKRDVITDGERTVEVDNGHEYLTQLTGTGCMSTLACAAFAAVDADAVQAAASALTAYGVAAELGAETAGVHGPASFKIAFFDAVAGLTGAQVRDRARGRAQ